jgi:hypothetical protein
MLVSAIQAANDWSPPKSESTKSKLPRQVLEACRYARRGIPPNAPLMQVMGTHKHYRKNGDRVEHWYHIAWDGTAWSYFGVELVEIPNDKRVASTWGLMPAGTILARHDPEGPVKSVWLVHRGIPGQPRRSEHYIAECSFARKDGILLITLPDGSSVKLPDPRKTNNSIQ